MKKNIRLSRKTVNQIFNTSENTLTACLELYKIAFPDWDNIKTINGWPKTSTRTAQYLFEKFIQLDAKNKVNCVKGGIWLNKGFSSSDNLPDWMINLTDVSVEYKEMPTIESIFEKHLGPIPKGG